VRIKKPINDLAAQVAVCVLGGHYGLDAKFNPDDQVDDRVCALGDGAADLLVAARTETVAPLARDRSRSTNRARG
jgi:hypothetical protein